MSSLRITEIFYSLQGESTFVGLPTIFIRLTGCPLRCQYCDTSYAFKGGKKLDLAEILQTIKQYATPYICVTGGEPLAQPGCIQLIKTLCDQQYTVSIETSGAISCALVDERAHIIMDIKTPDSEESSKNLWENLNYLKPTDQIKFVICSRNDYLWSVNVVKEYTLNERFQVLFSPSHHELDPKQLANWIVEDQVPVRFQFQLHKILWNDAPGH